MTAQAGGAGIHADAYFYASKKQWKSLFILDISDCKKQFLLLTGRGTLEISQKSKSAGSIILQKYTNQCSGTFHVNVGFLTMCVDNPSAGTNPITCSPFSSSPLNSNPSNVLYLCLIPVDKKSVASIAKISSSFCLFIS